MDIVLPVAQVVGRRVQPAPRTRELAGRTLGCLSNNKPNADALLDWLARGLASNRSMAGGLLRNKGSAARPAPDELYADLNEATLVLNALGD